MHKFIFSLLFSLTLIVLFTACKGGAESSNETSSAQTTAPVTDKKPVASQVEYIPITLNAGSKWEVSALTKLGIVNIKKSLDAIDVTANAEDYKVFLDNLTSIVKETYNSIDMEGEAKAQFANYVQNILQVKNYLDSSDVFVRQDAHDEMQKLLAAFNDYFQ